MSKRYLNQTQVNASQGSRMAIVGRDILRWLAQPHILNSTRAEFEALWLDIGDKAEEWLTSAESLGITKPRKASIRLNGRVLPAAEAEEELELELA
ncbi:MAG: hypothetical protein GFH27_549287n74 [Chloroflexi bacterium AL-W]|nr:hypothetical protein [Chloroflexi bacterium AL-N1]NOK66348.1 hypothetical protein [Chloroflexi bacterium AL-N10]NOK71736.1 hypothetical protein [Chloroflexi bacterium AL-N5]NOK80993.1 hypothetical protein [Chloroflexi bacterium AL-W]NOK89266.1 hypothetical protein [Chloroflexi bacterium AL-N15]